MHAIRRNRTRFPVRQRRPMLVMVNIASAVLFMGSQYGVVPGLWDESAYYPCWAQSLWPMNGMQIFAFSTCARAVILLFEYELTKALQEDKPLVSTAAWPRVHAVYVVCIKDS